MSGNSKNGRNRKQNEKNEMFTGNTESSRTGYPEQEDTGALTSSRYEEKQNVQ
jgi:hypothetical protein